MAIQIKRTTGSGPPTNLEPGQLAVEMNTRRLWVGVPDTIDPDKRVLLAPQQGLPVVQRIRIWRYPDPGLDHFGPPFNVDIDRTNAWDPHRFQVVLQFDRPIIDSGCRVQIYRYKKAQKSRRGSIVQVGFRALNNQSIGSMAGFPVRPIPLNAHEVLVGTVAELFRPPPVRTSSAAPSATNLNSYSRWRRDEQPPLPSGVPWPATAAHGTKVSLKFGVEHAYATPIGLRQDRGPMSAETLTIWLWRYQTGAGSAHWNLRCEVK